MFDTLFEKLNHLPVSTICDSVAEYFANQMIPIVTSEVASGKTLLIPAACALKLKDDPNPIVYVLQPTRFLSNNAAEALWSILGDDKNLVGVINSNRSDDQSILHRDNKIIFTTVGYALSAGILSSKHNFILDEAHETSIELSLAKAYLHERLKRGDNINIAELSATIDVKNELDYWGSDAIPFTTKGSAFPVDFLHRPAFSFGAAVTELIQEHGRKGILVFVSGVEEIEDAVSDITNAMFREDIDFEIETIHGNSTGIQRKAASRDRQSNVKILVGTNVLESGVSLSWVDGGVSSGDTKIMYARGNVRRLHKEELPRWRIKQQMGRVGRFKPGVFILNHPTALDHRLEMALPDIVRLPLTELVMHCTAYPDIHVRDLKFSDREQPKEGAITEAIATLINYGLISEDDNGRISLTDDGKLIQPLPLSYKAAAAVCEAHHLNMLGEMLPLIAMLDMGDVRFKYRDPMYGAHWTSSDVIMQVKTLIQYFYMKERDISRVQLNFSAEEHNVNLKKYFEFKALVHDLEKKTDTKARWECYLPILDEDIRKEFDTLTKQVIFRAMTGETYPVLGWMSDIIIPTTEFNSVIFKMAQRSNTTSVSALEKGLMVAGTVRVVTPKRGFPFAVVEQMTIFNEEDIKHLIKRFGKPTLERVAQISERETPLSIFLSGKKKEEPQPTFDPVFGDMISRIYDQARVIEPSRHARIMARVEEIRKEEEEPKVTGFGEMLAEALKKK